MALQREFRNKVAAAGPALGAMVTPFAAVNADATHSVKDDYIVDCPYAACAKYDASAWSGKPENANAIGISVRVGTKPAVTDAQIKQVLLHDLKQNDTHNTKFFFEQGTTIASRIFIHVKGGTDGPYVIDNIRQRIPLAVIDAKYNVLELNP